MEVKKTVDRGVRLQIKIFSVSLADNSRHFSCLKRKGANLSSTCLTSLPETRPEDAQ